MTNLLLTPVQDGALVPLKLMEKLCRDLNAPYEEAITILRQYDIIRPILCFPEEDPTYATSYIIPFQLRPIDRSGPEYDDFWQNKGTDVSFFFNFKEFNPEAVFIRLLARCLYVSQQSHDMSNTRNMYRDAGWFYESNDFYYKIELRSPSADQNLVQVTIGRAPEDGVRRLLDRIKFDVKDICRDYFPYARYTFGIQCEACREHPRHILDIPTHEEDSPSVMLSCRRQRHEVDFQSWPDTIRMVEDNTSVFQPVRH
ncbi:uncharacterized protein LOC144883129 isoform X2 [Branchiostoma floridae x Branchiostoma japonicum]